MSSQPLLKLQKVAACLRYNSVKMKMLLTVIIVLVLSTNRLVVADDQCTQYFTAPYYPGNSYMRMNLENHDKSGYILLDP